MPRGKRNDNHKSLAHRARYELGKMAHYGESKHIAKKEAKGKRLDKKIYSYETMKDYLKSVTHFSKWAETHGAKTLEQAYIMIPQYLKEQINNGYSAWTIHARASALTKLYGVSCASMVKLPDRKRADIHRSRKKAVRDAHFSEKRNSDLVNFCKCTGLRRHELVAVKGNDLAEFKGKYFVHVKQGKGGKERYAPIVGTDEQVKKVVELMTTRGENTVFEHVHSGADIHGYRADYAERVYNSYEREFEHIPAKERYFMRKDCKGRMLDKMAMERTSKALGHSRINVIAGHYLHGRK